MLAHALHRREGDFMHFPFFACTLCGQCCRDTILPFSLAEAEAWLMGGGVVGLETVVTFWDPAAVPHLPADVRRHFERRGLVGRCGKASVMVMLNVVGLVDGRCHNQADDGRCSIHPSRPLVCRAYPIRVNDDLPDQRVGPGHSECEAAAWSAQGEGRDVLAPEAEERQAAEALQKVLAAEKAVLSALAAEAGIGVAMDPHDGHMIHRLPAGVEGRSLIGRAKARAERGHQASVPGGWWRLAAVDPTLRQVARRLKAQVVALKDAGDDVLVVPTGIAERLQRGELQHLRGRTAPL